MIKYFGEWTDKNSNLNRVEILTNNSVISPIKVDIVDFVIDSNIDLFSEDACMGAGAKFSIVSETKLQYLNELYAINIKELKVIHYINSKINFVGYLNTEVYNDNFFDRKNYKIDLTANDGLSILDRIKLSDNNGNLFKGIVSSFDVLHAILRKLEIGYRYVNIALSSTIENYSFLAAENLLQKIYVNTDNYIDEKGNVMSCREVLDSILTPLTAKLYIYKNEVFIIDINNLAKENIIFKKYINPNLNYVQALNYNSTYTENNLFDIDVLIGNHNSTYSQGVNKLDVKFNKYVYDNINLGINENTISEFLSEEIIDKFKLKYYANNIFYLNNTNTKFVKQSTTDNSEKDEYYLTSTKDNIIQINTGIKTISATTLLKIKGEFMIEDKSKYNEPYYPMIVNGGADNHFLGFPYNYSIQLPYFYFRIECGDYLYIRNGWEKKTVDNDTHKMKAYWHRDLGTPLKINEYYNFDDYILSSWGEAPSKNPITSYIPLNSDNHLDNKNISIEGDDIIIKIITGDNGFFGDFTNNYNFRFRNIGITYSIKDENGNYIEFENTDSEIQGTINDDYINSESIDLIHGTDEFNNSRGGLLLKRSGLYSDSDFATNERLVNINNLIRNGKTGQIEELLLNTYLSNFQLPRYVINCSLQGYYKPFQLFKYDLFKRNNVAVKMAVNSIKTDYINSITDLQIREIVEDIL